MKASDAAIAALDARTDALAPDAGAAGELFAVVDLLESQPSLRRSLSDPSASEADRKALAARLFGARISRAAMSVLDLVVGTPWQGPKRLVDGLERQGIRGLLRSAAASGALAQVQEELAGFASTLNNNAELSDALRNRTYPVQARRDLLSRLAQGKVSDITATLLQRAAAARRRTVPLTIQSYLDMAAGLANQQVAHVTVAKPLDEARQARLRSALERQVGSKVVLQIHVDPQVLGGISVRVGDHIIESTVAGRLEDARRLLHSK